MSEIRLNALVILTAFFFSIPVLATTPTQDWVPALRAELERIDAASDGTLGVFVKRLSDGKQLSYNGSRKWYLASTIKVPVAIALLQRSEEGSISLEKEVPLRAEDFVDGSGDVRLKKPGVRLKMSFLLERMITQSDSTATDIIIKKVGDKVLNDQVKEKMVPGFGPITTLLQVRYDAYGELHPRAKELTNLDFIDFRAQGGPQKRLQAFMRKLNLAPSDLKAKSMEKAFEGYYERELNSASLEVFGALLEKLVRRQLLSEKNTDLLLGTMEKMVTGEDRLKAGMPKGERFAQKTGTQVRRVCNVGVVRKGEKDSASVIVAACLEKFSDQKKAEATLEKLGAALGSQGVLN